ncbi:MAG: hypothetical protein ABIK43_01125 [candidate division WOR-3 bacterium]
MNSLLLVLLLAWQWTTPYIPTEEVRPGMRGTGRSVFASSRGVEEFEAEVIDVLRQASPRGDLIICRLSGAGLEHSGIIAGMSGSPVYVGDRLLGAVAYAWPYAKDPLCGVTPAVEMLRIWNMPERTGGSRPPRQGSLLARLGLLPGSTAEPVSAQTRHGLRPIPLPVAVTGSSDALLRLISPAMEELGLLPIAGTGSTVGQPDTNHLIPGAPVGVVLADGDVRVSAIGTLTAREGNRVLAFGHPLLQAGAVNLPLCGGVVHEVLPSLYQSFKLFSPSAPLGRVTEDRLPGISGIIGKTAPMIPVTVNLSSAATTDTYRFRVADAEALSPMLIATGLAEVVLQTEGTLEETDLLSEMHVAMADAPPLTLRHRFTGTSPVTPLFAATKTELEALCSNPFRAALIESIRFDLRLTPGHSAATLVDATLSQTRARPHDSISIHLRLRDYRGSETTATVGLRLPASTPAGELTLIVASSDSLLQAEVMRAPTAYEPASFNGIVRLMSQLGHEDHLAVAGYIDAPGFATAGYELPRAPASLRRNLYRSSGTPVRQSRLFLRQFPQGRPVYGAVSLKLEVIR